MREGSHAVFGKRICSRGIDSADVFRTYTDNGGAMGVDRTNSNGRDIAEAKRIIADTFRQIGIINEIYTGEVTVGFNSGGVMFIRKSETLK